jgi:hypothetical protein
MSYSKTPIETSQHSFPTTEGTVRQLAPTNQQSSLPPKAGTAFICLSTLAIILSCGVVYYHTCLIKNSGILSVPTVLQQLNSSTKAPHPFYTVSRPL